jgi:cysteine desulfurase
MSLLETAKRYVPEMTTTIYLDNNATTHPLPEVISTISEVVNGHYGNPSSPHTLGTEARGIIRSAREQTASFLGCEESSIIFTSGASEGNNTVLQSILGWKGRPKTILTTEVEHKSILQTCEFLETQGCSIYYCPIQEDGLINLEALEKILTENDISLVSVGWANNETGVIQPMEEIIQISKNAGTFVHTDGVQVLGKVPVNLSEINVDFFTFSGHKVHSLQGIGGIYARDKKQIRSLIWGGDQENDKRAGTENLVGIASLGAALKLRRGNLHESIQYMKKLRDTFEEEISSSIKDVTINGLPDKCLVNTSNLHFKGVDGRALLAQLDINGIICSQSSACTSQRPEPSYVLKAMGLTEDEAFSSIRFSFSVENTIRDVEIAVTIIGEKVKHLRKFAFQEV